MTIHIIAPSLPPDLSPRSVQIARLLSAVNLRGKVLIYTSPSCKECVYKFPDCEFIFVPLKISSARLLMSALFSPGLIIDRYAGFSANLGDILKGRLQNGDTLIGFVQPFSVLSALLAVCRSMRSDQLRLVVHFSDPLSSNMHVPIIFRSILKIVERKTAASVDHLLVTNNETRQYYLSLYPRLFGKVHVLHHLYPSSFDATDYKASIDGYFTFTVGGTSYGRRNCQYFVEGLRRLLESGEQLPPIRLTLLGRQSPTLLRVLKVLADRHQYSLKVVVLEKLNQPDYFKLLNKSDVLVHEDAKCSFSLFLPSKIFDYLAVNKRVLIITSEGALRNFSANFNQIDVVPHSHSKVEAVLRRLVFAKGNCDLPRDINNFPVPSSTASIQKFQNLLDATSSRSFVPVKTVRFILPFPLEQAAGQRLKFEPFLERLACDGSCKVEIDVYMGLSSYYRHINYPHRMQTLILHIFLSLKRFFRLLLLPRVDVCYVFHWAGHFPNTLLEKLVRYKCARLIFDQEDWVHEDQGSLRSRILARKSNYFLTNSDAIVCSSTYLAEELTNNYSKPAIFIPPTLTHILKHPPKSYVRARGDILRIGWTGTYSSFEYFDFLGEIFSQGIAENKYELVIISDRPPKLNFPFRFIRWNTSSEVADLQQIDVGIYPVPDSKWVLGKSGLKVLQYLCAGICSVSSPHGMASKYIESGVNGFLADAGDEWVDLFNELYNAPDLLKKVGASGRQWAEDWYVDMEIDTKYKSTLGLIE
jgi:L-malate glycosyltransferase